MVTPKLPKNEVERQKELLLYEILDSDKEVEYDEITALAAQICGTDVSLMSLLDNDRQWFKSYFGLELIEAPRELAFCGHTINQENLDDLFIVENAHLDEDFKDHPYVAEAPNVKFYAGACLLSKNGYPLGTLCVIDSKPVTLNDEQKKSLKTLAKCAQNLMELRRKDLYNKRLLKELGEKNSELNQFVNIASHDLIHPVNNISSLSNVMIEDSTSTLSDKSLTSLKFIKDSSERLIELIRSVSRYSKYGTDKNYVSIKSKLLFDNILNDINSYVQSKKANVTIKDENSTIFGHEPELRILFQNLIINGIKFQQENSDPKIEINIKSDKLFTEISVSDNGIGIEKKNYSKIFDLFKRLEVSEKYNGTGAGLAICKKIVASHNGCIEIESELGKGTTFKIKLPNKCEN